MFDGDAVNQQSRDCQRKLPEFHMRDCMRDCTSQAKNA